jgi:RNA polymerase sigma factor (sigma-70 family)
MTAIQVARMSEESITRESKADISKMDRTGPESVDPDGAPDRVTTVWSEAAGHFRRWMAGDSSRLDDLVRLMTPVLWHVVRSYRLPTDLAEDVIQTTWMALVRRREAIEDPAAVGGWLTTTARREAWRVSRSGSRMMPTDDEEISLRLPRQRSAEQAALSNDEQARLWAAVQTLDDRCQRLLRIVAFEHRPDYGRVAEQLDMPIGSIGPTRGRCLAKLKLALAEAAFSDGVT